MNPQQTQPQPQQNQVPQQDPVKSANQAKANLGFITTMQEHLLHYKNGGTTPSQSPQNAPGQEQTQETGDTDPIKKLVDEVGKLREEVKGKTADKEIEQIRSELESLLNDESEEPNEQANETTQ